MNQWSHGGSPNFWGAALEALFWALLISRLITIFTIFTVSTFSTIYRHLTFSAGAASNTMHSLNIECWALAEEAQRTRSCDGSKTAEQPHLRFFGSS